MSWEIWICSTNFCDKVRLKIVAEQSQSRRSWLKPVANPFQFSFVRKKVREVWDNFENDLRLKATRKTFARIFCECSNICSVSQFTRNLFAIPSFLCYQAWFAACGLRSVNLQSRWWETFDCFTVFNIFTSFCNATIPFKRNRRRCLLFFQFFCISVPYRC